MIKTMRIVFSVLMITLLGCTVGTPALSSLAEFSGITFSAGKKPSETYTVSTNPSCNSELTISGQCDQRFNQLQFSIDNEVTWTTVSGYNSNSDGNCSDGAFKIYFPNVCATFSVSDGASESKKIFFRGDIKTPQNITREAKIIFAPEAVVTPVNLSIANSTPIVEGDTAQFTVTLSAPSAQAVTVDYSLLLGAGAIAADFSGLTSGTLSFTPGETSKIISIVTVNNSGVCEADKTFSIQLFNSSVNASIATSTGNSLITDNDLPVLNLVDINGSGLGENSGFENTSPGQLKAELSVACPTKTISFKWSTVDLTASEPSDYAAVSSQSASITPGNTLVFLNTTIVDDGVSESDETFRVVLTNITNATPGTDAAIYYILDDDTIAPPGALTLAYPFSSPSISPLPMIKVSGVFPGDDVLLFDASCTNQLGIATVAVGNNVDIGLSSGALTAPQIVTFKAKRRVGATTSACSSGSYTYSYVEPEVVPVYPAAGANWNDYVSFAAPGQDAFHQSGVSCSGSESGYLEEPGGCIHGGEKLKFVAYGFPSCSMVTLFSEALGAFDWICDDSSGTVKYYTRKLKSGKGLRDLIHSPSGTPTWKQNSISFNYNGALINSSPSISWWNNVLENIAAYPNGNSPVTIPLSNAGHIYVVTDDTDTFGYNLDADKVGIVTLGTKKLKKTNSLPLPNCNLNSGELALPDIQSVLCAGSQKFLWIEANLDGVSSATSNVGFGFSGYMLKYSKFNNSIFSPFAQDPSGAAIRVNNIRYNIFNNIRSHIATTGFDMSSSDKNIIRGLNISATGAGSSTNVAALSLGGNYNRFYDVRVANTGHTTANEPRGIYVMGIENVLSRVNVSNIITSNISEGIYLYGSGSIKNIFSQIYVSHAGHAGIATNGGSNNVFSHLTLVNNKYNALYLAPASHSDNTFISMAAANHQVSVDAQSTGVGNLIVDSYISHSENHAFDIASSAGLFRTGFLIQGNNGISCGSGTAASTTICTGTTTNGDLLGSFMGEPFTGLDSVNPIDIGAMVTYSNAIANYKNSTDFESFSRSWGRSGAIDDNNTRGPSSGSDLIIWDLKPSIVSNIRNRSETGTSANSAFLTTGVPCSGPVSASRFHYYSFLNYVHVRNAIEIDDDIIGNDNGLCEANENCFYTPHIGAYQGDSPIDFADYCTVGDGAGSSPDGVKVFKKFSY